ncbi:polysaccharide lyase family 8 super-sandwich domain-containing protein [Agromyces sp. SYSU T00194]|uniref:polysaccharide lyase family 8 super-sandwich domain-containing protein n=1 Tax=Agromyces chitinivorans TaxID=3158560 RepID=UPI003392FA42
MYRIITTLGLTTALVLAGGLGAPPSALAADPPQAVGSEDYAHLRDEWRVRLTGGAGVDPADPRVATALETVDAEGESAWETLDTSAGRTALWDDLASVTTASAQMTASYSRLADMALAYATDSSELAGDPALRADIVDGLQWMSDHVYNRSSTRQGNWWDWEIGSPRELLATMVLLDTALNSAQIAEYLEPVQKFSRIGTLTGANLVWAAQIIAQRGALLEDQDDLAEASEGISPVLDYVTERDGFYEDGSFLQHEDLAYTGGYGMAVLLELSDLVGWLDGSPWTVTDPDVANITAWVHDSFAPVMVDGLVMDMVRGREISRWYATDHLRGRTLITALLDVIDFAPPADADEFRGMVRAWIENDDYDDYFETADLASAARATAILDDPSVDAWRPENAYFQFAGMDRAVQIRPNYTFGLAMSSDRIATFESINGENLHGWYTGEGMTYLYNGDQGQYTDDFWPTVDPYRLPGITIDTTPRSNGSSSGLRKSSREAGGTEILGRYGTSAQKIGGRTDGLVGKKSWFAFDDEIVALGAGITSSSGATIETTIENRKLEDASAQVLSFDGTPVPTSTDWSATMTDVTTARLTGASPRSDIGYYFPGGATVQALRESRTGSWSDIDSRAGTPTEAITADYATLWIDHGANPDDAGYEYVLLPGASDEELSEYAAEPGIDILANGPTVQAVRDDELGVTAAQFWTATSAPVAGITSSARSAVMTAESPSRLDVSVSDPSQAAEEPIVVEIDRAAASVVSLDPGVTVTQLAPRIVLEVDPEHGETLHAEFSFTPPSDVPPAPVLRDPSVEDASAVVSWDPAPGATSYVVRYGTAAGEYAHTVELGPENSFEIPDVEIGRTYFYQVAGLNGLGSGPWSAEGTATSYFSAILDQDDASVTVVGDWSVGGASGFVGSTYLHDGNAGKGAKSVTFAPELPPGTYEVSMAWIQHANRSTAVPVTIAHDGAEDSVSVDQTRNGSRWNSLGTFTFTGAAGEGVTVSNAGTSGYVIVDGMRFRQLESVDPLLDLVVDEEDPGVQIVGDWPLGGAAGTVGAHYRHDGDADKGTKSVTFPADLPTGSYRVSIAWVSAPNRATAVPVTVSHAGIDNTLVVSQRSGGGVWNELGTFTFTGAAGESVTISNAGTDGYVVADGVRFEQLSTAAPLSVLAVDDGDADAVTVIGDWIAGANPGFLGGRYLHDRNTGKGEKSVRFAPSLDAGTYRVSLAWVADVNRATNAPVTIRHAGGQSTLLVDQKHDGRAWNVLGVFDFTGSADEGVTLGTEGTDGFVIADGVLFERLE